MPRTATKKKSVLTIGVFGLGEAAEKTIASLLEDHVGDAEVRFILPATKDHYTPSIASVADYADENDLKYEVVTDESSGKARSLRNLIKNASAEHTADNVGTEIVNQLKDADDGQFLVFWDSDLGEEDDGGAYDAVEYAAEEDVATYDFCDALAPLDLDDDEAGETDPEPEPEKPAPKRRGKAAAEAQDDAEGEEERVAIDKSLPDLDEAQKLGVRVLRNHARDLEAAPSRKIGSMEKHTLIDLLYPVGGPKEPEDGEVVKHGSRKNTDDEQLSLDDEVALAAQSKTKEKVTRTRVVTETAVEELNHDGTVVLAEFIQHLAKAIAEEVVEKLAELER